MRAANKATVAVLRSNKLPAARLDLERVARDPAAAARNARARKASVDVDSVVRLHCAQKALRSEVGDLRAERNQLSKGKGGASAEGRQRGAELKSTLARLEGALSGAEAELAAEAQHLPNWTHERTPEGGEEAAVVVGEGGSKRRFEGFEPRDHTALLESLGMADFESATTIAGTKFAILTGQGALLELALVSWAMHEAAKRGFAPMLVPDLVRSSVVQACGFNPRGEHTQTYKLDESELVLAATAEAPVAGSWAGRRLGAAAAPVRQVAFSHCFRTEVGSRGAALKGLYRLHQFSKVELFTVCAPPDSEAEHARLRALSEELLSELGLHWRALEMPSAELGASAYRKWDVEAWMPGRGEYGEVSSISNCTDFQARRLDVRHGAGFAHTLNGTALAVPRVMLSLLETHQRVDGSVAVPSPLQRWLQCDTIEPPSDGH